VEVTKRGERGRFGKGPGRRGASRRQRSCEP